MTEADRPALDSLSIRGRDLVAQPRAAEYLRVHWDRMHDVFHPEHAPDGYIGLSVAENKLVTDLIAERIARCSPAPDRVYHYDHMTGNLEFRRRLARFMGRSVVSRTVDPDHLAVLAGAGSVLEVLFYAIADPGDGVLVPTPSYSAFWGDLETRDELTIIPVDRPAADGFRLTTASLDDAVERATMPIRAMLFTSPDNPLGRVYTADEVDEVVRWAESRGIHLVVDEIYAISVHGDARFVSVAERRSSLGDMVHIVWAFSKDFGASGLRSGVLLTENEAVLGAVDGLAYWSSTSGHTQHILGEMVADDEWVESYTRRLRERLADAYAATVAALGRTGIRHVPADGGIFILCDFREFLTAPTHDAEYRLWARILNEVNVNLTPGAACHIAEPGFLRLCFASQPTAVVVEALDRIGRLLHG